MKNKSTQHPFAKELGKILRSKREELGLSLESVCAQIRPRRAKRYGKAEKEFSAGTLSRIERGISDISMTDFVLICQCFGLKYNEVFCEAFHKTPDPSPIS